MFFAALSKTNTKITASAKARGAGVAGSTPPKRVAFVHFEAHARGQVLTRRSLHRAQ